MSMNLNPKHPVIIPATEGYEIYATKSGQVAIVQSDLISMLVSPSQAEALAAAIVSIAKSIGTT